MRVLSVAALFTTGVLLLPVTGSSQSLGEIAEKQKQKRKGKTTHVITEDDLRKGKPHPNFNPGGATETASSEDTGEATEKQETGAPKEKSEEEKKAEAEKAWREKLQKTRDEVTKLSAEADKLQTSLNDVTGNLYGATRTNLINQLEKAKQQLAGAQKSVEDLEEEGRRNGYR